MTSALAINPKASDQVIAPKVDPTHIFGFRRTGRFSWSMREDTKRVLLFRIDEECRVISKLSFIHPSEAIVLSFFDGRRTAADVHERVKDAFHAHDRDAEAVVAKVVDRWSHVLVQDPPSAPIFDPLKFVIPADSVDLRSLKLYKPISLVFHPSDDCMRDCVYCNVQKRRTRDVSLLSLARYEQLATEAAKLDVKSVTFGGGDPFMRRDIVELVGIFASRGLPVMISTKSAVSARVAGRLASHGLRRIQVSVDSADPLIADHLTGSPGYSRQIWTTIANLREAGIKVRTNSVITGYNVDGTPRLIRTLLKAGVDLIRVSPYAFSPHHPVDPGLFISKRDYEWLQAQVEEIKAEYAEEADIGLNGFLPDPSSLTPAERATRFAKRAACSAGRNGLIILSDGKVIPCDEMPADDFYVIGDLSADTIEGVWNSPTWDRVLRPPQVAFSGTTCANCSGFDDCHSKLGRCFRDALKAYDRFAAPMPQCPRAPAGRRLM